MTTDGQGTPGAGPRTFLGRPLPAWNISLSGVQTFIGVATGIVTIGGALFAIPSFFVSPPAPTKGHVVAIIEAAKTAEAIPDARVEILTPQNALITTVTPNYFGKARHSLEEGRYRIRVSHPQYAVETMQVLVVKGETSELHVRMRGGSSSALGEAERVVKDGVGAVKRIFGQ
jgi:hypothetical protein